MLSWLGLLSVILVLVHPYQNVFNLSRVSIFLVVFILIAGRMFLDRCKYNRSVAVGNIFVLATFVIFLFAFSNKTYFSIRYIVAFGQFLNFVVVSFNGGRMPVEKTILARRGRQLPSDSPRWFVEDQYSRMWILNDRIYISFLSNKVISIGDVLTDVGLIITAVHLYLW
jgi:hypothetical protein